MGNIKQIKPKKGIKMIRENKSFNIQTDKGYISYIAGNETPNGEVQQGILTKLIGDKQYFYIEDKWVPVDGED